MRKVLLWVGLLSSILLWSGWSHAEQQPLVVIKTSLGDIWVQLYSEEAPKSVAHFLNYVDDGFYDGLIFHRVVPGFMIQGGGFTPDLRERATLGSIENEARHAPKNLRGTLALARFSDPDSADAQFFINVSDNPHLDYRPGKPGYTVFGHVIQGMSVVKAIEVVDTGKQGDLEDVPLSPIIIESIRRSQ